MTKRFVSVFFVSMLLAVGAVACSDDSGDGGGSDDTSVDPGDSGDEGGSTDTSVDAGDTGSDSVSPEVQAFCDQVTDFADAVAAAGDDPAALGDLNGPAAQLGEVLGDLSGNVGPADSEAFAACAEQAGEALATWSS